MTSTHFTLRGGESIQPYGSYTQYDMWPDLAIADHFWSSLPEITPDMMQNRALIPDVFARCVWNVLRTDIAPINALPMLSRAILNIKHVGYFTLSPTRPHAVWTELRHCPEKACIPANESHELLLTNTCCMSVTLSVCLSVGRLVGLSVCLLYGYDRYNNITSLRACVRLHRDT